jgi:hypothetical protein
MVRHDSGLCHMRCWGNGTHYASVLYRRAVWCMVTLSQCHYKWILICWWVVKSRVNSTECLRHALVIKILLNIWYLMALEVLINFEMSHFVRLLWCHGRAHQSDSRKFVHITPLSFDDSYARVGCCMRKPNTLLWFEMTLVGTRWGVEGMAHIVSVCCTTERCGVW